jgi:PAS domain S-box-containing protein
VADDRDFIARFGAVLFDSYFVLDSERRIVSFNPPFVQMLGARPSAKRELVGAHCYDVLKLNICSEQCIAVECLKRGAPVRMEEVHGTTAQGRELVLELSATLLRDDGHQVCGVFVMHRDVTDERRLKTRFLQEQQERRNEREALLHIIKDRDAELERIRRG